MIRTQAFAALILTAAVVSAVPAPAQTADPKAPGTPVAKQFYDIAVYDLTVDTKTCQLWVSYTNLGTKTITQTLGYSIRLAGVEVDKGFMGFNLAPGGFWSVGVGTSQNPVKVYGTKPADAHIDVGGQLPEPSPKRANNHLRKEVTGCTFPVKPFRLPHR